VSVFRTLGGLGLWFPAFYPDSTFARLPKLWHSVSIWSSLHLLTHAYCARCHPSILLCLAYKSLHLLEEGQSHPIVRFIHLFYIIGEESVFLSFVYIKLFELGVEITFCSGSAARITHYKVDLLKFPRRGSCSERTSK